MLINMFIPIFVLNLVTLAWNEWLTGHVIKSHLNHHDDVIKCKHFSLYWHFVRGIHQSPMDSPHKGQRCGALMFSLMYAWTKSWTNNANASDLRLHGPTLSKGVPGLTTQGQDWPKTKHFDIYYFTRKLLRGEKCRHYVQASRCSEIQLQCQKLGKIFTGQVTRTSYFIALWSFQIFTNHLFLIKLHLLSTVLLSGFQSSTGALKSTE